jgi:putative flavoprotein involved in K+ transport
METTDTLIIGAGPAGLSLSYYLTRQRRPHLLLEQAESVAVPWRSERWDSFTLVTPNWMIRLPGGEYTGSDPDGFMPRDALVQYLQDYADHIHAPIRFGIRARVIDQLGSGFRVQTTAGEFNARNVVVAAGRFQKAHMPPFAAGLPTNLLQLHSSDYRSSAQLPPGAVLVVGSAQSGCQIAEELYQSGRKVYLSTGRSSGRAPRRFRGRDILYWLVETGFFERTADKLPSPAARFGGNPHVSGKGGGRTLNLHQFARDGVTLLGHTIGAQDGKLLFATDLHDNLAQIDTFETELLKMIDRHIAERQLDAPPETVPQLSDGYHTESIPALDLEAAGITSLIWALGYRFDYSWVHPAALDEFGYPVQTRGATDCPGLYFHGLNWLHNSGSGFFYGFGRDAEFVARHLQGRD